jgi:hypothetical protein
MSASLRCKSERSILKIKVKVVKKNVKKWVEKMGQSRLGPAYICSRNGAPCDTGERKNGRASPPLLYFNPKRISESMICFCSATSVASALISGHRQPALAVERPIVQAGEPALGA